MRLKHSLVVIAGLDPAIYDDGAFVSLLSTIDRCVKPGDDNGWAERNPL